MKHNFRLTKWFFSIVIAVTLIFTFSATVWAKEDNTNEIHDVGGELIEETSNITTESGDEGANIFDEIYGVMEENADKIFSILAFVGTIIVSVGYKSGLLPLLRDALSKLKASIDNVKAEGELNKALTESKMSEISKAIEDINSSIESSNGQLKKIEWQFDSCEQLMAERKCMRAILENQIDMLYAIFMSSALPQYQKDEIGTKIQEMREELASYEIPSE